MYMAMTLRTSIAMTTAQRAGMRIRINILNKSGEQYCGNAPARGLNRLVKHAPDSSALALPTHEFKDRRLDVVARMKVEAKLGLRVVFRRNLLRSGA